jgi:hypothetical protein
LSRSRQPNPVAFVDAQNGGGAHSVSPRPYGLWRLSRVALAMLRLAQGDPEKAAATLAPVIDGTTSSDFLRGQTQAFLLEATARHAMGDSEAASRALEHALDLAELRPLAPVPPRTPGRTDGAPPADSHHACIIDRRGQDPLHRKDAASADKRS